MRIANAKPNTVKGARGRQKAGKQGATGGEHRKSKKARAAAVLSANKIAEQLNEALRTQPKQNGHRM